MAKENIHKVNKVEIAQSLPETITQKELDIIAACILNGNNAVVHINPSLNVVGVDDTINIKDYVKGEQDFDIENIVDNPSVSVRGTINVGYGYADVARAIMSIYADLEVNVSEDCIRFKDWRMIDVLSKHFPEVLTNGLVRKSTVASYKFPTQTLNDPSKFIDVEYFNEGYFFPNSNAPYLYQYGKLKEFTYPKDCDNSSGYYTFRGCTNLAKLHNFENNTRITIIAGLSFYGCQSLELTKLPPNLESINTDGFYDCRNISISSIPEGVETIVGAAFYNCSKITVNKIPPLVKKLDNNCFKGCTSLTSIDLSNVDTIGYSVFEQCPNLTDIYMYNINKITTANNLYMYDKNGINLHVTDLLSFIKIARSNYIANTGYNFNLYDKNGNKITTADISELDEIPAFSLSRWNCPSVMNFPNVTKVNNRCCASLTNLVRLNTKPLTYIGDNAFASCTKLEYADVSEVYYIGAGAFTSTDKFDVSLFDFLKLRYIGDNALIYINPVNIKNIVFHGGIYFGVGMLARNSNAKQATALNNIIVLDDSEIKSTFRNVSFNALGGCNLIDFPSNTDTFPSNFCYGTNSAYMVLRSTTVMNKPASFAYPSRYLFVPEDLVETYKTTTGWTTIAARIKAIRSAEWRSVFGTYDEYADYPDEYKPQHLQSISVELDITNNKLLRAVYNDWGMVFKNERGFSLSVVSPTNGDVIINADNTLTFGKYFLGEYKIKITSTYNPSISSIVTFTL